ncbi:protein-disulfide reductase DsbD domain-containing protein [Hyphomicrobium sp. CS1GBMeth3]|uniref:protein-disulfide reductase DsbD domain-containing protein n=1 Tax=Hyphomicrobium sp. CS1GBMeth3 TaxID=1892845 RepID=UPI000930473D|nr:protein-disulfide reductase DsbD domain-containing protein [Hyphomicrobium sp. CS1GBMeth3]
MSLPTRRPYFVFTLIFALIAAASSGAGQATAASSPWVANDNAKVRLFAGRASDSNALYAFVEIVLAPGWKTYWRTPGDAGGLPPTFDWSKSRNLAAADVAFPAPRRFTDRSGNTIGYDGTVVLPVALKPQDLTQPISLVLGLHYGICKDICIPAEAELALEVPADGAEALSEEALDALDRVPRPQDELRDGDPALVSAGAILVGSPKITISARFPKNDAVADVFLEAPDGLFVPLPERVGSADENGVIVFEAPLGSDVDTAAFRGRTLTVTLVGETGASTATFVAQ